MIFAGNLERVKNIKFVYICKNVVNEFCKFIIALVHNDLILQSELNINSLTAKQIKIGNTKNPKKNNATDLTLRISSNIIFLIDYYWLIDKQ